MVVDFRVTTTVHSSLIVAHSSSGRFWSRLLYIRWCILFLSLAFKQ